MMNVKLEKQIADMEAKLQEMREELHRREKWEPKGGRWTITSSGSVLERTTGKLYAEHGTERSTKEQAEKAVAKMRVFNRLLAYVDEHAPDYKPDWNDHKEKKFRIFYDHYSKRWLFTTDYTLEMAGAVYMPRDVAIRLCDKLNSGEVVL